VAKVIIHREVRDIVKKLEGLGLTVTRGNGSHLKVYSADGKYIYSLPSTPGRGRWKQNLVSALKARGIILS
jgi:hypothetical protein